MKNVLKYSKGIFFSLTLYAGLISCGDDDDNRPIPPDPPTISAINPASGVVGETVIITGENFGTKTSDISVSFNGTTATVTASTETSITTSVSDGATTGTVNVTIGTTVIQGGPAFTVTPSPLPLAPVVTSYNPSSGGVGTAVTITGANFSTTIVDNVVSFNGTVATVTAVTETTITTTVPVGATTGPVTVTVDGQIGTGPNFTVGASPISVFTSVAMSGVTVELEKVQFADANTAYVAGEGGTILKSTDGGITWTDLTANTGVTDNFENLFFIDANTGWAVGDKGIVTKTTNGGMTWISQTAGTGTTDTRRSIFFVDANIGYVGGSGGVLGKTTDGGATWAIQTTGLETARDRIYDIYFWDANKGIAVAEGGNIITTSNGGNTWALQSDVNGGEYTWKSVKFLDANNGWVVGSYGQIYNTTNGGTSWTSQTSPSDNIDYNDLVLLTGQRLIAVGGEYDAATTTANLISSAVVGTSDGGATWTRISINIMGVGIIELNGIAAPVSSGDIKIIGVGEDGTILKQ